MKYFIGIRIPKNYKNKIELLRAKYNFFTTEPHITLVPPSHLPNDDSFIKEIIEICKETKQLTINLGKLRQYSNEALYIDVNSPEIASFHEQIYKKLNLIKDTKNFIPHLTVIKQKSRKPINMNLIKKRADNILISAPKFNVDSIIIYQQPKEKSIYLPYMRIPLE